MELPVEGGSEVPDGHYVVVAVERPAGRPPRGKVIEVLGEPDAPGVDVLVVLRHHNIPEGFPPTRSWRPPHGFPPIHGRRTGPGGRICGTASSSPSTARRPATSTTRCRSSACRTACFRLGVHIADVSHYVREGDALDLEAYQRGTSVYYPDRAIPMLPEGLSNGLCSLRPQVPRLTTSVFLDINRDGGVTHTRFAETVIRSTRRMTYNEVRRLLEEPAPGDADEYGPILPVLREMHH